jgi:aspartate aminotransferase
MNSPANPTGVVFSKECMANLLAFTQRHNLYLLSDECYDEITFGCTHISPAALLSPREFEASKVVCVYSFSKTYAMTGWRIGYVVANKQLITTITNVIGASYTNVSKIVQRAAATALEMPRTTVDEMITVYRLNRDVALNILSEFHYTTYTPNGAFYLFLDISPSNYMHCKDFCYDLVRERNIVVAPGTAFGKNSERYIRISLAASRDDIAYALREICEFITFHARNSRDIHLTH